MIHWQRALIWPLFLCVLLLCLFVLSVTAPSVWERVAESPATADPTKSIDAPRVVRLPPVPRSCRRATPPSGKLQPVEPARKYGGHVPDGATPGVQVLTGPSLGRVAAVHEEVGSLGDGKSAADPSPLLLVHTPTPIGPLPHRLPSPTASRAYPNTGLSPELPAPPRADQSDTQPPVHAWQEPAALFERLDKLASERATRDWATETGRLLRQLGRSVSEGSDEAVTLIRQLEKLTVDGSALATAIGQGPPARKLRRTGHALKRRFDVWLHIVGMNHTAPAEAALPQLDPEQLSLSLAGVDALVADSTEGKAWREYLLLDAMREWSAGRQSSAERLPLELAQRALQRLSQTPLSVSQRRFLSSGPVAALAVELRPWAAEPVDSAGVLAHLERYEQTQLASDAKLLARDCLNLGLSADHQRRRLAQRLAAHYRNANIRIAVTEKLLNRLMPERLPVLAPVHDRVLGVPVRGRSATSTKVSMRLLADPHRVRMALEITGQIASLTSSKSGPATFYNDNKSTYTALKSLEFDLAGIRLWPAKVEVHNRTRLHSMKTNIDGIPLIGSMVRGAARKQHEQKRQEARAEIKRKVARKTQKRIDAEAGARLGKVSNRLRERLLDPLEAMSLDPTIISAETTKQRFTLRLRLAGEDQLGGHTPRPRAPADSLVSFQIHQSAMNNSLARLGLDGRKFTLKKLSRHVAQRLNRPQFWETTPAQEDVTVTFAKKDAVAVRLRDGQLVLTLSIAKLKKAHRSWKNFQVRAFYRPQIDGRDAELVRDGIIHLIGRRLNTGSQIALRGIFARTFPKNRPLNLTPERLGTDPKLADLVVTQFVIDDGWIGVALGPVRTSLRPTPQRR